MKNFSKHAGFGTDVAKLREHQALVVVFVACFDLTTKDNLKFLKCFFYIPVFFTGLKLYWNCPVVFLYVGHTAFMFTSYKVCFTFGQELKTNSECRRSTCSETPVFLEGQPGECYCWWTKNPAPPHQLWWLVQILVELFPRLHTSHDQNMQNHACTSHGSWQVQPHEHHHRERCLIFFWWGSVFKEMLKVGMVG